MRGYLANSLCQLYVIFQKNLFLLSSENIIFGGFVLSLSTFSLKTLCQFIIGIFNLHIYWIVCLSVDTFLIFAYSPGLLCSDQKALWVTLAGEWNKIIGSVPTELFINSIFPVISSKSSSFFIGNFWNFLKRNCRLLK